MFRLRRYRVFLLVALFTILGLYQFGNRAPSYDYLKGQLKLHNKGESHAQEILKNPPAGEKPVDVVKSPPSGVKGSGKVDPDEKLTPPPVEEPEKPVQAAPPSKEKGSKEGGKDSKPSKPKESKPKHEKEKGKSTKETEKNDSRDPLRLEEDKDGKVKTGEDGRVRVMPNPIPANSYEKLQPLVDQGMGRTDGSQSPLEEEAPIYWEKPTERFPIPEKSVINLPTGTPKTLPKVQAVFKEETAEQKKDRLSKQEIIKEAFLHAWKGYKDNAWGKDELMPVSGGWKNPFNGWGATLVDSLDLMWMMGLKDEFEEAVEAVGKIDFKTSKRHDIPLFETTIRYLGGLIGAYDVSEGKYRVLLDKAAELAEILIGSFDTPNRMPDTFYAWKPQFANAKHRASTRVVLAELGSLAVEFTRLAQLTKEPRYYDAIARITDALEEWQDRSRLPGMWPSYVDASGCAKPTVKQPTVQTVIGNSHLNTMDAAGNPISDKKSSEDDDEDDEESSKGSSASTAGQNSEALSKPNNRDEEMVPLAKPDPLIFQVTEGEKKKIEKRQMNDPVAKAAAENGPDGGLSSGGSSTGTDYASKSDKKAASKAEAADTPNTIPAQIPSTKHDNTQSGIWAPIEEECGPQGLMSQSQWGTDEFTLGSLSDSTYEYLPKMYLMLNGLAGQYKTMYEKAINMAKDKLLFRAMIPDEKREILVSGTYRVTKTYGSDDSDPMTGDLSHQGSHLTCFVGGMFGLGAKLFDRKEDLDIAAKLTDGCVWAYGMTATGVMPELFDALPCPDRKNCEWNETRYYEWLDPNPEWRENNYQSQMTYYEAQVAAREKTLAEARRKLKGVEHNIEDAADKKTKVVQADDEEDEEESAAKVPTKIGTTNLQSHSDMQKRQLIDDVTGSTKKHPAASDEDDEDETYEEKISKDDDDDSEYDFKHAKGVDDDMDSVKTKASGAHDSSRLAGAPSATDEDDDDEPSATETETAWTPPTLTEDELPPIYSPDKPPTHEEFVKNMIKEDRLPPGIVRMTDRRYILRPEAIESVFYMHRLTGSPYWRKAGWNMVSSMLRYTRTPLAHSAIDDVTKQNPNHQDSMESFWLAETLKYAWLLFEDEKKYSLDEWVYNTEAHPLKIDKSGKGFAVTGKDGVAPHPDSRVAKEKAKEASDDSAASKGSSAKSKSSKEDESKSSQGGNRGNIKTGKEGPERQDIVTGENADTMDER